MREENEFVFGEEETLDIVQKYEDMLKHKQSIFFDVIEFESIIDYYLTIDNASRALEAANIAHQMHPYSSEIRMRRAEMLVIEGKYDEALGILQFLSKIEPENGELYFLLGQVFLGKEDFKSAQECFSIAIACPSEDLGLDLTARIAAMYQERDEYRLAITYLTLALEKGVFSLNVLFELGFCYEQINEYDKSIYYYNQYLDINPFSSNVWYNLGIVYSRKAEYDEALEAYDFALAISPSNSSALNNLASTYASLDLYPEAIELFEELALLEPLNPKVFCTIGECYEKLQNYPKALEAYQRCLTINPSFAEGYYGIGVVMLESKQLDKALGLIQQAISIDENNYDFWLGLGKTLYELHRVQEALDAYKEATNLNPEEPDGYLGQIEILLYLQRFDEVENLYGEIAIQFNDVPLLKVIRAAAQYLSGNPFEALCTLKDAKKVEPDSVSDFLELVPTISDPDFMNRLNEI